MKQVGNVEVAGISFADKYIAAESLQWTRVRSSSDKWFSTFKQIQIQILLRPSQGTGKILQGTSHDPLFLEIALLVLIF